MERFDSFVATSLLRRLRRDEGRSAASAAEWFRGAALFVDISGYTALAESLCSRGADGVEQLGRILDGAFRRYVRTVGAGGGEIACFAGDAFLAYWPADDGQVARAAWSAYDTAAALHALADVRPAGVREPMPRLHIGLAAGDIWAARLGDGDPWHLLLAGPAVRHACSAAARAGAGTTVLAADAGPLMTSAPEAIPTDSAGLIAGPTWSPVPVDVTGQIPRRIQEYIGEGYAAWVPQRRAVCALFARIDGLDESAPEALSRYRAVVSSLHVALRPYTGSTGTLMLDDKGLVFTLCLGRPHDTHADDPVRAVRAGLAVRSEMSRLGLDCAIGIADGEGVCMPLGGSERRHYWSVGRFMHLAGRLMEAAGSGVLCTEPVADRVRRVATLSPERELPLKGVSWPVRVFRVHEAFAFGDSSGRLFGREDEEAALDQYLSAFEEGRGTVVWIVGEAGIGKTAILDYLRRAARRRGVSCLTGGAESMEIAVPYSAWRPVFAKLLRASSADDDDAESRRRRLGSLRHPQLAPLVNAVVPGFLDETPLVQGLTGQARADATSTLLEEILEAHATRRFVLAIEDGHWMDSASWRLLLRIAQDYPEALIVLTSRPATGLQEGDQLRGLSRFVEMKLAPLRPDAIAMLVETALQGRAVAPEIVSEVAERSAGNPLFAREYALLLSTGADRVEAAAAAERAPFAAVPVTVQNLIASRLDALTPAEDLILKTASVIGEEFGVELMTRVCPGEPSRPTMEALLSRLVQRQLLARLADRADRFTFEHALIREVTYQQLTGEQRRDLHRAVAESLEGEHGGDLRPHFAALAHHYLHAEVPDATLRYSAEAASQALAAGAFEEAERLLGTCLDVASGIGGPVPASDRIRWHRQLADARHGLGQLEARSAAAHEVLRAAGLRRPHSRGALVLQALLRICRLQARRRLPAVPHASAATILDVARAFRHSAEVCYFNNDMIGMMCDSVGAVAYASSLPPSAVLVGASTELGGILSVAGLRQLGERMLNRAIAMAEAAGDQAAQAYAHMISCLYYVGRGDWSSAERSAHRCQELCEPMDDRVNWTNAQAVWFWMSHYRAHDAAAVDAAQRLHDRAVETGNRQHRAWGLRCLAVCALRRGEATTAARHLVAALDCLGETAALNERVPTLGVLALAQLKSGSVWSARATAREALAQIATMRRPIGQGALEGYACLTTVALHAWQDERSPYWKDAVSLCLRVLRRYTRAFPVGEPRYRLQRGEFDRLQGSLARARRSYRLGEAAAVRLGMPWEAKRCREALAELSAP